MRPLITPYNVLKVALDLFTLVSLKPETGFLATDLLLKIQTHSVGLVGEKNKNQNRISSHIVRKDENKSASSRIISRGGSRTREGKKQKRVKPARSLLRWVPQEK